MKGKFVRGMEYEPGVGLLAMLGVAVSDRAGYNAQPFPVVNEALAAPGDLYSIFYYEGA